MAQIDTKSAIACNSRAMAKAKVTNLREVAKAAQVSIGTASMAFSANSAIAERTRAQVLRVAAKLGYKPNIHARSLVSNKSFLLGLLGRESMWMHALDIIRGIQDMCLQRNYSLVTYLHGDSSKNEREHLDISLERNVDGLIVMPALDADGANNFDLLASMRQGNFPVVQLFSNIVTGIPSIRFDEAETARRAVQLLVDNGHTRIAHVTHNTYSDNRIENYYYALHLCHSGYESAMKAAGLPPVVVSHPDTDSEQNAAQIASDILNHPSRPTAAFFYSDAQAWNVLNAMQRMGKRCPDDFSIAGSNALYVPGMNMLTVTSFNRDYQQMGLCAARMCFDMLAGQSVQDIVLQTTLKSGETVARPPADLML